jgi:hypothetical protein
VLLSGEAGREVFERNALPVRVLVELERPIVVDHIQVRSEERGRDARILGLFVRVRPEREVKEAEPLEDAGFGVTPDQTLASRPTEGLRLLLEFDIVDLAEVTAHGHDIEKRGIGSGCAPQRHSARRAVVAVPQRIQARGECAKRPIDAARGLDVDAGVRDLEEPSAVGRERVEITKGIDHAHRDTPRIGGRQTVEYFFVGPTLDRHLRLRGDHESRPVP